jgi:hypothetical protein
MKNIKPLKMMDPDDGDENKNKKIEEVVAPISNYLPILDLPSKFRLYPEGTKILAKPLKVPDIKLLASMNENNYDFVMNDVIRRSIKGINFDDLLIDDKHFIIFWLRANTYKNSGYEVDFKCMNNKCLKNAKYKFDVDVLDVAYLRDDYVKGEQKELPTSKDKISIKFKTILDENKIQNLINVGKTSISKYDDELIDLAGSIDKINGEDFSLIQKYEYVVEMNPEDFSYLVSYVNAFKFGVKDTIRAKCNHCKEESPIGVTFRKEFFLPEYKF